MGMNRNGNRRQSSVVHALDFVRTAECKHADRNGDNGYGGSDDDSSDESEREYNPTLQGSECDHVKFL